MTATPPRVSQRSGAGVPFSHVPSLHRMVEPSGTAMDAVDGAGATTRAWLEAGAGRGTTAGSGGGAGAADAAIAAAFAATAAVGGTACNAGGTGGVAAVGAAVSADCATVGIAGAGAEGGCRSGALGAAVGSGAGAGGATRTACAPAALAPVIPTQRSDATVRTQRMGEVRMGILVMVA